MTVKSSDVLRLAAELALSDFRPERIDPLYSAILQTDPPLAADPYMYAQLVSYNQCEPGEHSSTALCLAAAIAEDAGD